MLGQTVILTTRLGPGARNAWLSKATAGFLTSIRNYCVADIRHDTLIAAVELDGFDIFHQQPKNLPTHAIKARKLAIKKP
jgi:hypothetical protein